MHLIAIVARVIAGGVLVIAGTSKLRSRAWGLLALESGTPRVIVLTLPAIEVLLGAAVAFQLLTAWLPWLTVVLYVLFTVFVTQRYLSGSDAGCNCFGTEKSQEPVDRWTIGRNVLLVVVALVGTLR